MQGIDFVVDEKGHKKAAIVDLKKYGAAFEDFIDGLVATSRKKEPKSSLSIVRKRLSIEKNKPDALEGIGVIKCGC